MNLRSLLLLLACAVAPFIAHAQNANDCVSKVASSWGQPCEKCEFYKEGYKRDHSGNYQIELENTCRDLIEVKVAMQEKSGTWRTFPVKALMPQEKMIAFACQGTGKYLYWARRVNDTEVLLPSDHEILTSYAGR
ncbi:MAG: hypothetical protein KA175_01060 [Flavobacteriales bacterium]|nr:hypothetical protein [Flavobacteriales bacterium]MBP6696173.1 hypothetical protein [Flavobacteriales bacterium]